MTCRTLRVGASTKPGQLQARTLTKVLLTLADKENSFLMSELHDLDAEAARLTFELVDTVLSPMYTPEEIALRIEGRTDPHAAYLCSRGII